MNFNNQYRPNGFGYLPVVTKNIIIINVILYLSTQLILRTKHIDLTDYLGLHYYLASDFKPHQFVTYIFMHSTVDPSHIIFNMLGVYLCGQVLEQYWGPKRYLIFYIVTGFGAALAQYVVMHYEIQEVLKAVNENIDMISDPALKAEWIEKKFEYLNRPVIVGASGSLYGLLGAFGMLFPNMQLYFLFLPPIKVKWVVIFLGASELYSGLKNNPMDNVGHIAHLGGLFVGIIIVLIWRKDRSQFY